jgi:Spy/CpxP family protein refolding chaperone
MSITREMKIPALPMAVGFVLSSAIALQPAALPVFAQEAPTVDEAGPPQVGGVMAFSGGDIEVVTPQFAGLLAPPMTDEFHVGPGEEGHEGHHHHGFSEANKMTDDQYERMYAIRSDMQDQMCLKGAQLKILHRKLRDCLSASSIDTKQAQDLASKITALKSDITQMHLDGMIKMAQVLTPEQRKELHLMMIKGHHHHGHHHHMWGHGPGHEGHEGHEGGPSHEHHGEMGK